MATVINKTPIGMASKALGFNMGDALAPQIDGSSPELDQMGADLQARANNPQGIATKQYMQQANEATNQINRSIASTRGITPEQAMAAQMHVGADTQHRVGAQAGVMGLQEQQANQNLLANFLMNKNQQNIAVQQANNAANDKLLGMGLTAAGYAFGGPAGGMMAQQATSGMGQSSPMPQSNYFSQPNPFAGAPAPTQSQQYNPANYNMGQALKFNGGY